MKKTPSEQDAVLDDMLRALEIICRATGEPFKTYRKGFEAGVWAALVAVTEADPGLSRISLETFWTALKLRPDPGDKPAEKPPEKVSN